MYINHTADEIKESYEDILQQWNLDPQKMAGLTTDNASNNKKAFKQYQWLPCFGHNLDLAVRKGLSLESVSLSLSKLRKLISSFNRSSKRKRELFKKQAERGLPQHKPIHDEPTRWGSTFEMIERFLEQQAAFCAVLADDRKSWTLMPQDPDLCVYETVKEVLGPLSEFTDALSGEKEVTISCILPVLWKIFASLSVTSSDGALAEQIKQIIADDLKSRYTGDSVVLLLDCATYLDVRFKNTFVSDIDQVKGTLISEMVNGSRSDVSETDSSSSVMNVVNPGCSEASPPFKRVKPSSGLSRLLAGIKCEKQQSDGSSTQTTQTDTASVAMQIQNEIVLYHHDVKETDTDISPLSWWSKNADCYKHLSRVAKKYLCVAATSVASERVFSTSGNVVSAKRSRLDPETVDQLTFLAKNLDLADNL